MRKIGLWMERVIGRFYNRDKEPKQIGIFEIWK